MASSRGRLWDALALLVFIGSLSFAVSNNRKRAERPDVPTRFRAADGWSFARAATLPTVDTSVLSPVVEYSDFYCSYCASSAPQVVAFIDSNRPKIHHEFRYLPRTAAGFAAAIAAECASRLGQGRRARELLFAQGTKFRRDGSAWLVAQVERMDALQFRTCEADTTVRAQVVADQESARANGVSVTPTFVVGRTVFQGFPGLAALDSALAEYRSGRR
jgi:protein-disulfide isomerase